MTLLVKPRPQPDLGGTNATYICGRIVTKCAACAGAAGPTFATQP